MSPSLLCFRLVFYVQAMTMAMSYQVTDPEVKSLFAGGPRNVSKLRTMLQEQFIQEEMAKLVRHT